MDDVANLAALVGRHAAAAPERIAITGPDGRSLSWSALDARVDAVAAELSLRGLVAGQRVGLTGPNSPELVVGWLAVLRAGLVAVPISALTSPDVRDQQIAALGVRLLLTESQLTGPMSATVEITSPPDAETLAAVIRNPSGRDVMLSHRALVAGAGLVAKVVGLTAESVVGGRTPLPAGLAALGGWLACGGRLDPAADPPPLAGYAPTEAVGGVTTTIGATGHGHGHVGRPLPGIEVRIGDGSDESEPGPIFVRGTNLFSGYWPNGEDGPGPDGWFGTGELGLLADGELYLVDRADRVIVVRGFHVYPSEVEEVIAELRGVQQVAVTGHEQVVAYVVAPGLDATAIAAHCAGRLARFKRPATINLVDALPAGVR